MKKQSYYETHKKRVLRKTKLLAFKAHNDAQLIRIAAVKSWWLELKDDPERHAAYIEKLKRRPVWNKDQPMSPETKKKMMASRAIRDADPIKRAEFIETLKQRPEHSAETRAKISASKKGQPQSEESRVKRSTSLRKFYSDPANREKAKLTHKSGPDHHNYGKPSPKGSGRGKGSYCLKGHWVRSRWERGIADWLYRRGIAYEYEPKLFDLGDGFRYRPDFYLSEFDRWIEVKGFSDSRSQEKIKRFRDRGNTLHLVDRRWWRQYSGGTDLIPQNYL